MISKTTLAYNAARAKAALQRQEAKVRRLCDQLIEKVGTGGETIKTNLGMVVVTAQTSDRTTDLRTLVFDQTAYENLDKKIQDLLESKGVVSYKRQTIRGQEPKVQFRLV